MRGWLAGLAPRVVALVLLLPLVACGAREAANAHRAAAGSGLAGPARAAHIPDGDWTRFDFNAQRTGVGPASTGISAHNLHQLRRRVVRLDGTVDSAPIQVHNVMIKGHRRDVIVVTTTYGRTLAIAASGKRLWQFTPHDIGSYQGSYRITTATPVLDPDRRHVYAAAPDGFIRKLSLKTGHPVWASRTTFDPRHEKIAAALNISGPSVVVATGGYIGDAPPYQGHVILINRRNGHRTRVWNSLCSARTHLIHPPSSCPASDSAIWARAGAVVEPSSGDFLVATGNGPFNGSTDWGESVVELSPKLRPLRHWTPRDQAHLSDTDSDLGSTAPALLPGGLAVQGGKAGVLSLLALHRLSGMHGRAGHHLGGALQSIAAPGGGEVFSAPAVWTHAGRTYAFVGSGETCGYALRHRRLHRAWCDGSAGTSPVVAGGLLFVYDPDGGRLNVFGPKSGHQLASLPAARGHWNSPIVIGGRIILPVGDANEHATSGKLFIWHLPGR